MAKVIESITAQRRKKDLLSARNGCWRTLTTNSRSNGRTCKTSEAPPLKESFPAFSLAEVKMPLTS